MPLFAAAGSGPSLEPDVRLPPMPPGEPVVNDYRFLSLSLKAHPVSFVRERLDAMKVWRSERLADLPVGRSVTVAGLVLVRQRPGSARGVVFLTIEDETGIANIVIWPDLFEKRRRLILSAAMLAVAGRVQREGEVVHVIARTLTDFSPLLRSVGEREDASPLLQGQADPVKHGASLNTVHFV